MEDKGFNYYRLLLVDKHVATTALKDIFELLWDMKYPLTPWENNDESVKQFEAKVKEVNNKKKENRKKVKIPYDSDGNWNSYKWDTNKVVYALVDSKLFDGELKVDDDEGKPVSEHICDMRKLRNQIAHLTSCGCETDRFTTITEEMSDHINALNLLKLEDFDVPTFINKLQDIKSQTKPVLQEFYKEKQRIDTLVKQIETDRKQIVEKYQKIDSERRFLIDTIKTLRASKIKQFDSEEENENGAPNENTDDNKDKYEELDSDFGYLAKAATDVKNKSTVKIEQLQEENDFIEKIVEGINMKHNNKLDEYQSENDFLKEKLSHSAELSQLKHTLRDVEKELKEALEENEKIHSENTELKELLEKIRKENHKQRLWKCQENTNMFQVVCVLSFLYIIGRHILANNDNSINKGRI